MVIDMFNIGSLIIGIGAWVFAILAIISPTAWSSHKNTTVSFGFCVFACALQLFEINRRVQLGDFAAIEDTIRAVLIAAVTLVLVTTVLNLLALLKARKKPS